MKRQALLLLALVVTQALAVPQLHSEPVRLMKLAQERQRQLAARNNELQLCGTCINFAHDFLQELLNIILNIGVGGTCTEVCGILADKTNNKYVGVVCDIICVFVGFDVFVKVIEKADLDPIYYCELLKLCEIKDDGDATIEALTVQPSSGPQGIFKFFVQFSSKNGTGTGEAAISVRAVDGLPIGDAQLMEPQQPGTYNITWTLHAEPDPDCDPSQGPCEEWEPGVYPTEIAICNGQCGSKHPHSQIYTTANITFTIVEGN